MGHDRSIGQPGCPTFSKFSSILKHQDLASRHIGEKDADGELAYEAWIHIAWDKENAEYAVMWLDNTGTTNFAAEGVGHGKPDGDRIPFVWKSADGSGIHNTFAYDRGAIPGLGPLTTWTLPGNRPRLQGSR